MRGRLLPLRFNTAAEAFHPTAAEAFHPTAAEAFHAPKCRGNAFLAARACNMPSDEERRVSR
jgi:hypothetical protein